MRIATTRDSDVLARKRKIEMEITLLTSDMKKVERAISTLRMENHSLDTEKKRIILELDRNASLLRMQEANLQRITADLAVEKRRLNGVR